MQKIGWCVVLNILGLTLGHLIIIMLKKIEFRLIKTSNIVNDLKKKGRILKNYEKEKINLIVSDKHYKYIRLLMLIISNITVVFLPVNNSSLFVLLAIGLLLLLAIIDVNHLMLPDELTQALLWLSLLWSVISSTGSSEITIVSIIIGYLLFWLLRNLGRAYYNQEVIGGGDVKLVAALSGLLSWSLLPFMLLIACGITLALIPYFKNKNIKERYPFGLGLAIAGIVLVFWRFYVAQSSGIFFPF